MDDGLQTTLPEAGEIYAALGGAYQGVRDDDATRPTAPWIDTVAADQAVPEFRYRRLVAVTF